MTQNVETAKNAEGKKREREREREKKKKKKWRCKLTDPAA